MPLGRGEKVNRKLGVIFISALMLTTIIGGCGAKKGSAAQQVTTGQSSASVSPDKASIQKIDPKTQQGQAELDKGLDQKMQSLDSALDKLDKSIGSL